MSIDISNIQIGDQLTLNAGPWTVTYRPNDVLVGVKSKNSDGTIIIIHEELIVGHTPAIRIGATVQALGVSPNGTILAIHGEYAWVKIEESCFTFRVDALKLVQV